MLAQIYATLWSWFPIPMMLYKERSIIWRNQQKIYVYASTLQSYLSRTSSVAWDLLLAFVQQISYFIYCGSTVHILCMTPTQAGDISCDTICEIFQIHPCYKQAMIDDTSPAVTTTYNMYHKDYSLLSTCVYDKIAIYNYNIAVSANPLLPMFFLGKLYTW